jgi:hypothetical protein
VTIAISAGPAVSVYPAQITLAAGEALIIQVAGDADSAMRYPQITSIGYFAGQPQAVAVFALGAGLAASPGVQFSWLVLRSTGGAAEPASYSVQLAGTICDTSSQATQSWTATAIALTLASGDFDPESRPLPWEPAPPAQQQYLLGVASRDSKTKTLANQDSFHLHAGDVLGIHVCGFDAFGTSFPGIQQFQLFDEQAALSSFYGLGAGQPMPDFLCMPSIALKNNGLADARYSLTLSGVVVSAAGSRFWTHEPELTLKTTIGGPPDGGEPGDGPG